MKLIIQPRTVFIICCVSMLHFFLPENLYAQDLYKGIINGIVVDDSTNTFLPFANIFIAGSTIGTASGNDGKFQISNAPYGVHQVVVSFVGYQTLIATINIVDTTKIEFRLRAKDIQLSPVEVLGSEPLEWKRNLEDFISDFFGNTQNAKQCKLLNPEVLDFTVSTETSELSATVREPLIIENKALGYRLYFYLKYYVKNKNVLQFYGVDKFEQLQPENAEEMESWKNNRQKTYYGSKRHFFYTLFHKKCREEGFQVRWSPVSRDAFDSRNEFNQRFAYELDPDTLATEGKTIYEKELSFQDILLIKFGDNRLNVKQSGIILANKPIIIYSNGELADPLGIWTYDDWTLQRAAEFLPWDYEP